MKNFLHNTFLLAAFFAAQSARADVAVNATNFPNEKFREYVADYIDRDPQNGSLSDDEMAAVTTLSFSGYDFKNLKGIGFFTNLEYLDCRYNPLTSLDLSQNPNLHTLYAEDCSSLRTITWGSNKETLTNIQLARTAIQSFDLSDFTNLTYFSLEGVTTWGKTLDVSGLTKLYSLGLKDSSIETLTAHQTPELGYSSDWPVKTLDFTDKGWGAYWHSISGPYDWDNETEAYVNSDCPLETLILSNAGMSSIDIFHFKNLKTIDLSGCDQLSSFNIYDNDALTSLDLTDNPALEYVNIYRNRLLKQVTWGDKTTIRGLNLSESQINAFDLSGFTGLWQIDLRNCTSWGKTLDVSGLSELQDLYLNDSSIETLIAHQTPRLGYSSEWPVKTLDFSDKGWEGGWYAIDGPHSWDSEAQTYVNDDCPLETVIMSGSTELTLLEIRYLKNLKAIDLSGCDKLEGIEISNNSALASLDLSGLPALETVTLQRNPLLKQATWGNKTTITQLNLENSSLKAFDLSGFTSLYWLSLQNCTTWGKTLDVSGLNELRTLYLEGSSIETLIAHQTPSLNYDYNWPVKTLDFSNKGEYGWSFDFSGNYEWDDKAQAYVPVDCPLETLILSDNGAMEHLAVTYFKNLKAIDLTSCNQLYSLTINDNSALASLDLSGLPALKQVTLQRNPLLKQVTWGDKTAISDLDISQSSLTPFDVREFTNLSLLGLSQCTHWGKTLDVSGMQMLGSLNLDGTGFETLVAHQTPYLYYTSDWPVKTLDFSDKGWTGGWYYITGSQKWDDETQSYVNDDCPLETLILSDCKELTGFAIRDFKSLKTLDVSGCNQVTGFEVSNNDALTDINLDGVTALDYCYVYDNAVLPRLDLSQATVLSQINGLRGNALMNLDLSKNAQLSYWGDNDQPQRPKMELVTITADKVGVLVPEEFDASKVTNLKANGTACTPSIAKISGSRFLIVSANAADAAALAGKNVSYEYLTGWVKDGVEQTLKVQGDVAAVGKCFTKLAVSPKDVSGTYGAAAPEAPNVVTSSFYDGVISYTSGNEAVVKVAADGTLTVVGAGTAKVTVKGAETEWRQATNAATYTVTIAKASPKLQFANAAVEMTILDEVPVNALTRGVYDGSVTFTSSNTDIATVAADGKVTVKAAGTVTITASAPATNNCNKPANASYTLTIHKKTAAINIAAATVNGTWGQSLAAPTVTTTNGYDGTLSYTSSNKNVVTVAANGKLTVKGAGSATITVKATETALYSAPANATYKVVVAKATPDFHFAQDMVIADEGYAQNELSTGIYDGTVTFSSSNEEIATVDAETGELTFLALGSVTITAEGPATTNCNAVSATYQLEVTLAVGIASTKATFDDGHFYTVDGIAVDKPVKGRVYIRNGKKVMEVRK